MKPLPSPDQMDFELPAGHCCLVMDDGTDLTVQMIKRLQDRGWPVVVLSLPISVAHERRNPAVFARQVTISDLGEEQLRLALSEASSKFGPAAVFIHLHPDCGECGGDNLHFTETSRLVLQEVFLVAKYLKDSLNKASHLGKAAFMTVVRLDGEFGLGERNDFDPTSGGLFGLVKSLNLEWESVFCRAVDLDPEIDAALAAELLLAELQDPNRRLVEVGYSSKGRTTLALEPVGT